MTELIILPDEIIIDILRYNITQNDILNSLKLSKNINNSFYYVIHKFISIKATFNYMKNITIFPTKILTKEKRIKIINCFNGKFRNRTEEPILINY